MALNTKISAAAGKASVDSVVDLLSGGTGNPAKVVLSDGAQPAHPGVGTPNTIAEFPLGTAAETGIFDAAATDTATSFIAASLKTALTTITDASAATAGTPLWFRAYDQGGVAIIDGSVGLDTGTFDLELDNVVIATGQTVKLTAWKVRQQFK